VSYFSDDRMAELREVFFESAQELLQSLNDQALALEKNPQEAELLRDIRRTVHTLKGDSAAVGFSAMSELAHELEDALDPEHCQDGGAGVADVALAAADEFHAMLQAYRGNMKPPSPDALRRQISNLVHHPEARSQRSVLPKFSWSEVEQVAIIDAAKSGKAVFDIGISIDPKCPVRAAGLELLRVALRECGEILAMHPADGASDNSVDNIEAAICSPHDSAWIETKLRVPSVTGSVLVQRHELAATGANDSYDEDEDQDSGTLASELAALPSPTPTGVASAAPPRTSARETTLRVDASRIDDVLNLVGELIIGKSMLVQSVSEFGRRFPKDKLFTRLSDAVASQTRVLDDLQKSVMKIRMVPVEQLFRRFPRLVRDVAKQTEKDVNLVLSGESTDVDKGILDMLAEPLAHLVRNAVDHGIEPAEQRVAAGKSAHGTIRLNAFHHANQVVIEVSDDGGGIDRKRLLGKAIERKMLSPADAERLSDPEILDLIFHPGFSTAERISQVSGRGVGLDVVRAIVDRLKGSVTVSSTAGMGTTFVLRLPVTLAIVRALLFGADDRIYALPLNTVREIARMNEDEFTKVDGRELAMLRDEVLPIIRLSRSNSARAAKRFVIVVSASERVCGLVVDRLVGEEELVIKALDDPLIATDLVNGASILGDGSVALVLNVSILMGGVSRTQPAGAIA
jgi:two-component system, chemotaxis family, sensor kinase CheA